MIDWKYIERISSMLTRHILRKQNAEETAELERWRHRSKNNKQTFDRLIDTNFLRKEYLCRESISSAEAKEKMQYRLERKYDNRKHKRSIVYTAFVSSLSTAAIIALGFFLWPKLTESDIVKRGSQMAQSMPIMAGTTKATLSLPNGKKIVLSANSAQNIKLINTAEQGNKQIGKGNNILSTPRGGEFKVTLEDGTTVWLNADSKLYYPDSFNGEERRVKLQGEAFFEVSKDAKRPFYVETDKQVVRVYGTQFNINAYPEEQTVLTTLLSGSISLQLVNSSRSELMLTPGHQAQWKKNSMAVNVHSVDTEQVSGWRNGWLVFDDMNLEQIMRMLARWYDITYEFKSNALKSTLFMGSISRYSDFGAVIETLEKCGNNLKFVVSGNHHIVISTNK